MADTYHALGDLKLKLIDLGDGTFASGVTLCGSDGTGAEAVEGKVADGAALTDVKPMLVAGQDGTLVQSLLVDTSGRPLVAGAAAAGAALAGNPVLGGLSDGANARALLGDTAGRPMVVGAAADGAAVVGNPLLMGGQDGTNAQSLLTDTSGRPMIVGAAAAAAALAGNPVLVGFSDGTSVQTPRMESSSQLNLRTALYESGNEAQVRNMAATAEAQSRPKLLVATFPYTYNGASYDTQLGNNNVTVLASAARTVTVSTALTNYNGRFLDVILNVTAAGTGSITLSIEAFDPVTGTAFYTLLTGAAVTTNSTNVYKIGPGLTAAANLVVSTAVPRSLQITLTHNNANSISYSVGACVMMC